MSQQVALTRIDLLVQIEHTLKSGMDEVKTWAAGVPNDDAVGVEYAQGVKDATTAWLQHVIYPIGTILNEEARADALMIHLEKLLAPGD